MAMSHMRRVHLAGALFPKVTANRRVRRSFLLRASSRCKEEKRPDETSFKYYLKTFMKQWKKDLAAIEDRSKARRQQFTVKPIPPKHPKEFDSNQSFYDYLKLEKKKAIEAWNDTKPSKPPLRSTQNVRPKDKIVRLKNPPENNGSLQSFEAFLEKKKKLISEYQSGNATIKSKPQLKKSQKKGKGLPLMNSDIIEQKDEMVSAKNDSVPDGDEKDVPPSPELKMQEKYVKTEKKRDKVLEKMREKLKNNEPELRRLLKLRAFLTQQEMNKLKNKLKNYEKKIANEERRLRETCRVMKNVKQNYKETRK